MNKRTITAYHEAGHAAMRLLLGGYVSEIRIDPDDHEEGHVVAPSTHLAPGLAESAYRQGGDVWQAWLRDAFTAMAVSLAGPIAEQIYIDGTTDNCTVDSLSSNDWFFNDLDAAEAVIEKWLDVRHPDDGWDILISDEMVSFTVAILSEQDVWNFVEGIASLLALSDLVLISAIRSLEMPKIHMPVGDLESYF